MIVINRIPPEEMLAAHERVRQTKPAPSRPSPVNMRAAREITERSEFPFRGRMYPVRPVPFNDGLRLLELAVVMEEAGTGEGGHRKRMLQLRRAVHEVVDLCWSLQCPRWLPRFIWRLRRNPFRSASLEEVREIVGFSGQRRMT